MERIWLKSYPPGMPADVTWNEFKSVGELFETSCRKFADQPAFHCMANSTECVGSPSSASKWITT